MPARQRQDRWLDLVQAVALVALVVGLVLLVVVGFTEGIGKADNWASVLGTSLTIIGGIVALVTAFRRRRSVVAAPVTPEQLVQARTVLAEIVLEQWRREGHRRSAPAPSRPAPGDP